MEYVYTSLHIFGVLIEEPITSLTDVITGLVGLVAYVRLNRRDFHRPGDVFFKYYFLFIGIATVCAGILGHATQYIVGFNAKTVGWTLSALALFCLERAALAYYLDAQGSRRLAPLKWLFRGQLVVFLVLVLNPGTRIFEVVQVNAALAMVGAVLPLFLATHRMCPTVGTKMAIIATVASFLPGLVFRTQFSLHTYLNYHDISHLFMAICVYLLYRAARQLGNEPVATGSRLERAE